MDAAAFAGAGVIRRTPYAVSPAIGKIFSDRKVNGFIDESHLSFYSSGRRSIRCSLKSEDRKVKDKTAKKVVKKRTKLLKNLSRDLSTLTQIGFGLDTSTPCDDLLDQDQQRALSEAAEALLTQLGKLRVDEAKCKTKQMGCCEDSSSSSSESSDSECEDSITQRVVTVEPKPVTKVVTQAGAEDTKLESSVAVVEEVMKMAEQRIEVCMGGKCKKSGAQAILDELQRAVGIEGAVSGCKCMGKCKVGPNVRISAAATEEAVAAAKSTCVGVSMEDVSIIASNFLSGNARQLGLAAS